MFYSREGKPRRTFDVLSMSTSNLESKTKTLIRMLLAGFFLRSSYSVIRIDCADA